MIDDLVRNLRDVLERERADLLAGNLSNLNVHADEKSRLTALLEAENASDLRMLEGLASSLERNARLLQAAGSGVTDVLDRLKRQTAARTELRTYDKNGAGLSIATAPNQAVRRV